MNLTSYEEILSRYVEQLTLAEKSPATCRQYRLCVRQFLDWLGEGTELCRAAVLRYKEKLEATYRPATVNLRLTALNSLFSFLGRPELRVKQLRLQREAYCAQEKELTTEEYQRLVKAAQGRENETLALLLQTLCGTGIRVSELRFITVEAAIAGEAKVRLKGKHRRVLLPGKLCRLLRKYAKARGLTSGPIFVTRTGRPLDRSNIWRGMKSLCTEAQVNPKKVFPHNLRHLFARRFYALGHDLAKLADILGHSSVNTTRIYLITTGREHRRLLDRMELILE